jgi:hypothetical protein
MELGQVKYRIFEIVVAMEAILWGLWIGNPHWDAFSTSSAYTWMEHLAPEWLWGYGIMALGVVQLIAVLWLRSIKLRTLMALLGIFTWMMVVVAFGLGNWQSTAVVVYSVFAIIQAIIYTDGLVVLQRRKNGNGE